MLQPKALAVVNQVRQVILGKDAVVCKVLMAILARGHILLEDNPGVGKTTLARIIARKTKAEFIDFSAVTSGIKEIRQVMQQAEQVRLTGRRTIVFVDEIHRFNKAQQDRSEERRVG